MLTTTTMGQGDPHAGWGKGLGMRWHLPHPTTRSHQTRKADARALLSPRPRLQTSRWPLRAARAGGRATRTALPPTGRGPCPPLFRTAPAAPRAPAKTPGACPCHRLAARWRPQPLRRAHQYRGFRLGPGCPRCPSRIEPRRPSIDRRPQPLFRRLPGVESPVTGGHRAERSLYHGSARRTPQRLGLRRWQPRRPPDLKCC